MVVPVNEGREGGEERKEGEEEGGRKGGRREEEVEMCVLISDVF